MKILKELFSGWVRIWIYLGLYALYKGNKGVFYSCLGLAGVVLVYNSMSVLADLLDKLSGYDNRKYRPSPGISREPYDESESVMVRTAKTGNNVVYDPLEGPLIINHASHALEDEFGNKRADLDEINETNVKDSKGHYYNRNWYR